MPDREIREVLGLMNWLLALPPVEEIMFRQDLGKLREEMGMPNLSTYDRLVWEEGLAKGVIEGRNQGLLEGRLSGLQDTLIELVEHRFGPSGHLLRERMESIQDETELRRLARCILSASCLEDFSNQLPPGDIPSPAS
jgi:hypothetical protein